jgi:hypothetical protein
MIFQHSRAASVLASSSTAAVAAGTGLSLLVGLAAASESRYALLGLIGTAILLGSLTALQRLSAASTRLIVLFAPASYVLIVLVSVALTRLHSPLKYPHPLTSLDYTIFVIYLALFVVGGGTARILDAPAGRMRETLSVNDAWLRTLFAVAVIAQAAKFVDIRHIPLLGDPASRYSLTLPGFADYPSRLLAPLSLLFFWRSFDRPDPLKYRVAVGVAFLLNLLFLQRQEVVNVALGSVLIWGMRRRISVRTLIVTVAGLAVITYGVIGVGAVIRLGSSSISSTASRASLPLWIVHREFTAPYALGQYVVDQIGPGALHGTYSFGTYERILGRSTATTGAPLIQKEFTSASTAQTVGAPYSYYLDFGSVGVAAMAFVSGLVATLLYRRMRSREADPVLGVAYATVVLALLWSMRAGVPIVGSLVVYLLCGLLVVSEGGSGVLPQIRMVARPLFALSLVLGVAVATARVTGLA